MKCPKCENECEFCDSYHTYCGSHGFDNDLFKCIKCKIIFDEDGECKLYKYSDYQELMDYDNKNYR